jgi:hypothetical protein
MASEAVGLAVSESSDDAAGNYSFPELAPGTYNLSAEESGFNATVDVAVCVAGISKWKSWFSSSFCGWSD